MTWNKISFEVFPFKKIGESIIGIYEAKETGSLYGNSVYKIKQENGKTVLVFGTTVLDTLMSARKIGEKLKIVYTANKDNKNKGLNAIKVFDVYEWSD